MKVVPCSVLFLLCVSNGYFRDVEELMPNDLNENGFEYWTGRWFPDKVTEVPFISQHNQNNIELFDSKHGIKMGIPSEKCDNAKVNLTLDWDYSPDDYLCFYPKNKFLPNPTRDTILLCEHIPKSYVAHHVCMDQRIKYTENIPTYGEHRPLWAQYGEYKYLPPQRWVHNLEHGAIVMLYHPCANFNELNVLRKLVKGCLYRHIITPYKYLSPEQPLALVAWGCYLTMSTVEPKIVTDFIKFKALRGPEQISRNGQYNLELTESAEIVSDLNDSKLCLNYNM